MEPRAPRRALTVYRKRTKAIDVRGAFNVEDEDAPMGRRARLVGRKPGRNSAAGRQERRAPCRRRDPRRGAARQEAVITPDLRAPR